MPLTKKKFLARVLDNIELEESRLLVWGVVDGSFELGELSALINAQIDSAIEEGYEEFLNADAVLAALQNHGLIMAVDNGTAPVGYRSRMAETARLLLRLRQLFPKHTRRPGGWLDAPTLVADFRFQRRRRQYPRRNIPAAMALRRLRAVWDDPALATGIEALLKPHDPDFKLAEFQVRAAERILTALRTDQALATIVCAGTGSGKTLSFYLPALGSIVRHRTQSPGLNWVKAVALYPRTELLKDQLREILGRALELRQAGVSIRVGALFGETPMNAAKCDWPTQGPNRVCPSLRCLNCDGDLLWREADYSRGTERLVCAHCHFELDHSIFMLTRQAMGERPPDVLFSTTEMLNQRLADSRMRHLFGVGPRAHRAPELVLLDEVHTYDRRHGAQVAYLMRRWQWLVDEPLRFVGLSATLQQPDSFFASLTGVKLSQVEAIEARTEEIEREGAEYLMALRGDPVSRTALLSTTIQTCMLLERTLDPRGTSLSDGLFGQRTFVFTDDLDVTNRLYFDLLSAEGRDSFQRPDFARAPAGGLAGLRAFNTSLGRYRAGQDWRACEQLGHQLATRLNISRVSSQDRGFDADADVVVATAALEVGFDDPLAGAVIQHKAPRGSAGFLQRRGRAGRQRGMRPWTVVVLSDYGRDRLAYQAYDQLFDPHVAARSLPLRNRTIQRMQSVYGLMDFLGQRLESAGVGSVWTEFARPDGDPRRKQSLLKELQAILDSERSTARLQQYLEKALRLPGDVVSALLWEFPRPLMTVVTPTAVRRLVSGWSAYGQPGADFQVRNNPLPEFIPATLFSELNLAEVLIDFPGTPQGGNAREAEVMSALAALREFAPGRVSRRFGTRFRSERYWVAPSSVLPPQAQNRIDIDALGEHTPLGTFELWEDDGRASSIEVFRPLRFTPSTPPVSVADSSNARLSWHTQLIPLGETTWLPTPPGSAWENVIGRLGVLMHAKQSPCEVRRFTTGSIAEIGMSSGTRVRGECSFERQGKGVGLGITFPADAIVVELKIPTNLVTTSVSDSLKGRAIRTSRFLDLAWRGDVLAPVDSPFLREWLAQILLSALTYEAIHQQTDLRSAAGALHQKRASITLQDVLTTLFQSQVVQADDQLMSLDGDDRLRQELAALLHDPGIVQELHAAARVLWEPPSVHWRPWLEGVYQSTLAAAILRAIGDLCPTLDTDDLVVDLGRGPMSGAAAAELPPGLSEIWITERAPGGNGNVEEFLRSYAEDPRRFFSTVRAALEVSEFELIDQQLNRILATLLTEETPSEVRQCVQRFRSSGTHADMAQSSKELRLALVREGFSVFHGFLTSLSTRILRRGSGPTSDAFVARSMQQWTAAERRLGVEIDLRIMAYCLSLETDIDTVAREAGVLLGQDLGPWRMSAIYGLLWPRGRQVRHSALHLRNPFAELPPVERLLVIDSLQDESCRVSVQDDQWFEQAAPLLSDGKLVTLTCEEQQSDRLANALSFLITNPVDSGYLRTYARLQRFRNFGGQLSVDVELAEAVA